MPVTALARLLTGMPNLQLVELWGGCMCDEFLRYATMPADQLLQHMQAMAAAQPLLQAVLTAACAATHIPLPAHIVQSALLRLQDPGPAPAVLQQVGGAQLAQQVQWVRVALQEVTRLHLAQAQLCRDMLDWRALSYDVQLPGGVVLRIKFTR